MKDAIGGSLLLNIVVIFTSVIILMFVGILAYSKAYKIKNRVIEVIEENAVYNENVADALSDDLTRAGYRTATKDQIKSKCENGNLTEDWSGHLYCVYRIQVDESNSDRGYYYQVVTYVHFDFPVIGSMLTIPVKGETKILGKIYNY